MDTNHARVVVLGAGVGGVVTANRLRKLLPKSEKVVVVEREKQHVFAPSLLWLMTGDRKTRQITTPVERLQRRGIEVLRGTVEQIDPIGRQVRVNGRAITGDYLVIALGADFSPEIIPGLTEAGHNFYTVAGAEALRDSLKSFRTGRLVVLTAAPLYKCPAAPYEAAMLLKDALRRRGHQRTTVVHLYAAEPGPMGVAGPDVSAGVRRLVEESGISYFPDHQIVSADPLQRRLVFANGHQTTYDLLCYVPPHRVPAVVRDADGLVGDNGWVRVDRNTMATERTNVYAIGDVVGIPLKMGKLLPKAGVFAEAQARVVASNIARATQGRQQTERFDGEGQCFLEVGDGKAGFGSGNFYAEPTPQVNLKNPGRGWHLAKVFVEKSWFWRWF